MTFPKAKKQARLGEPAQAVYADVHTRPAATASRPELHLSPTYKRKQREKGAWEKRGSFKKPTAEQ